MKAKRIREYQAESGRRIVYAYSGSRVIAIGTTGIDLEQGTAQAGDIIWTHAIGYGPFGPAFVKNLDGQGFSYFIFTDHLGTPFAYHNPVTGQTYYTPYNQWGELLAQQPNTPPAAAGQSAPATPYGDQQAVTTAGFSLPADHIFDISPIAKNQEKNERLTFDTLRLQPQAKPGAAGRWATCSIQYYRDRPDQISVIQ